MSAETATCDPCQALMLACLVQDAANRGSVKNVQIKGSNSNWQTLNNVWGASWETGQVPGHAPRLPHPGRPGHRRGLPPPPLCNFYHA